MTSIRGYSKPIQELDGELNVDITLEPVLISRGMRRHRFHEGTLPAPTGNVLVPRGEGARDGLALVAQILVDAAEGVEVDPAGL